MGSRRFSADAWMHIYKRRRDGFLIFYSIKDYLVYFTLYSVLAVKYRIKILGLCFMPDHIHSIAQAGNLKQLTLFEHESSRRFAREWNTAYGKNGQVFDAFGSAPKYGNKEKRSVYAYVVNNPVERHLCKRPELFKWNFMLKKQSVEGQISKDLLFAMERVSALRFRLRPLTYAVLENLARHLSEHEIGILVNHIINSYNVIDYEAVTKLYGDYEQLRVAVNSNVGGEYEIKESFVGRSDAFYSGFTALLKKRYPGVSLKDILNWNLDKKLEALLFLSRFSVGLKCVTC